MNALPDLRHLVVSLALSEGRGSPRYCEAPGCGVATREGKPFCSEHVDLHPYAQAVLAEIEEREHEVQDLERRRSRAFAPRLLRELLRVVSVRGPSTVERLARETGLPYESTLALARIARRSGFVRLGFTKRGSTYVRLALTARRSA